MPQCSLWDWQHVHGGLIRQILGLTCQFAKSLESRQALCTSVTGTEQMVAVLKLWPSRMGAGNRLPVAAELGSRPELQLFG